jgi:hypothetical protein
MVSEAGNELPGKVGDDVIDEASLVPVPVNSLIGADNGERNMIDELALRLVHGELPVGS